MKKFTKLLALFLVAALMLSLVLPLVSCGDEANDKCDTCIDADGNGKCDNCGSAVTVNPPVDQTVKYTVNVKAISGEALHDVMVFIYDSNNDAFLKYARTDASGNATFDIDYSATYYVQIDNVPTGYVVRDSYNFQAGKTTLSITLATTLLPEASLTGEQFQAGDTMRDITLTDIDGNVIRLVFQTLTEERRKDIVKQVKKMSEDAKVALRNIRRDCLDSLKKMNKAKEMTDDEYTGYEADVEKSVAKAIEAVEKITADKEKELLTV